MTKKLMIAALPFLFLGLAHAADRDIAVSDLPTMVTDAIKKAHPNAKFIKAEEETNNGVMYYEVKIQEGQTYWEIHAQPDGKLTRDQLDND